MAMTATGSVAAINAPKMSADDRGQCSKNTIPAATAATDTTVPKAESTTTGTKSARKSFQGNAIAASNNRGGRITSKMKSRVNTAPTLIFETDRAAPTITSPTV